MPRPLRPEEDDSPQLALSLGSPATKRKRTSWAKLLARVFAIDVTRCVDPSCGGRARVVAWITKAQIIDKILSHFGLADGLAHTTSARAPPQMTLGFA